MTVQKAASVKKNTLRLKRLSTRVKTFMKMHQRYCKKFCTMTGVFMFSLIEILALK
jgi:hypothetical protein